MGSSFHLLWMSDNFDWMPDIVIFTFLGTVCVYISINILVLCFRIKLLGSNLIILGLAWKLYYSGQEQCLV